MISVLILVFEIAIVVVFFVRKNRRNQNTDGSRIRSSISNRWYFQWVVGSVYKNIILISVAIEEMTDIFLVFLLQGLKFEAAVFLRIGGCSPVSCPLLDLALFAQFHEKFHIHWLFYCFCIFAILVLGEVLLPHKVRGLEHRGLLLVSVGGRCCGGEQGLLFGEEHRQDIHHEDQDQEEDHVRASVSLVVIACSRPSHIECKATLFLFYCW